MIIKDVVGNRKTPGEQRSAKELRKVIEQVGENVKYSYPRDNEEFSEYCKGFGRPIVTEGTLDAFRCVASANTAPSVYEMKVEDLWEMFQEENGVVSEEEETDTTDEESLDISEEAWKTFQEEEEKLLVSVEGPGPIEDIEEIPVEITEKTEEGKEVENLLNSAENESMFNNFIEKVKIINF